MRQQQYTMEHCGPRYSIRVVVGLAFRMADKYRNRLPTPKELMDEYGMSRATAFRWVKTMRESRGQVSG